MERKQNTAFDHQYKPSSAPPPHGQGQSPSTSTQESEPSRLPDLPFEVITDILFRLPVKSLLKFSVKTESWRSIGEFQGGFPSAGTHGSFVNGKLHWQLNKEGGGFIVFLDLATEIYGSLDLAIETSGEVMQMEYLLPPSLDTFGGILCLYHKTFWGSFTDVWVMKEYGVQELLTKVFSIPDNFFKYLQTPVCMSGNGRLLVVHDNKLKLYDPKDKSSRLLKPDETSIASLYVESLFWPYSSDLQRGGNNTNGYGTKKRTDSRILQSLKKMHAI